MPMTPQDIQSQQFHVRFRGFDVEEVDNFLEKVAEEYLVLMEENQELHQELEKIRKEIDSYRAREKSFQNAIMSAQQIAEEMKIKSRKEAQEIVAAAREEARQIQKGAHAEVAALEIELDRLGKLRTDAARDLRQILENYLAQLEGGFSGQPVSPKADADPPGSGGGPESNKTVEQAEALVDLSDLYEKVEIADEEAMAAGEDNKDSQSSTAEEEVFDLLQVGKEESAPESTVPDLEGDMLFTLEDPLDEGPAVTFEEEREEEEERGKGR